MCCYWIWDFLLFLLLQFDFFAGSVFPVLLSTAAGLGLGLLVSPP
jgi:hypothetical protein